MADIHLRFHQSPNAFLAGTRPSAFPVWGGQDVGSTQVAGLTQPSIVCNCATSVSPDARAFDTYVQFLVFYVLVCVVVWIFICVFVYLFLGFVFGFRHDPPCFLAVQSDLLLVDVY